MMGSSNQEEIIHGSSSLVAATPTLHGVGSNNYEWNQALMLNCGDFTSDANEVVSSIQREFIRPSHEVPTPPLSSLLLQDLGLQWSTGNADSFMSHPDHQLNLSKIKQELSADALISKLNEHYQLNEKLFLWSTSPLENSHNSGLQPPASISPYNQASFAFDLPSATTTARLGLPPLPLPGSADMNIHALHLLASARVLGRSFCQPSLNGMALLREDIIYGPSNIQEAVQGVPTSCSHEMVPSLVSGVTEPRPTNSVEHKASQIVLRKPRFESRSSFSSFKVRKEKLGDRIAALQQIVAPFGKTDTASVLMEAIGYIKFLQSQVETLSVPYRRPSNKKLRTMQGVANDEKDEPKLDLRSRGLCLVPLSCTSYVTNENGGVW